MMMMTITIQWMKKIFWTINYENTFGEICDTCTVLAQCVNLSIWGKKKQKKVKKKS